MPAADQIDLGRIRQVGRQTDADSVTVRVPVPGVAGIGVGG